MDAGQRFGWYTSDEIGPPNQMAQMAHLWV